MRMMHVVVGCQLHSIDTTIGSLVFLQGLDHRTRSCIESANGMGLHSCCPVRNSRTTQSILEVQRGE